MKQIKKLLFITILLFLATAFKHLHAQSTPEEAKAKADAELKKKAAEWVSDLKLNDAEKEQR